MGIERDGREARRAKRVGTRESIGRPPEPSTLLVKVLGFLFAGSAIVPFWGAQAAGLLATAASRRELRFLTASRVWPDQLSDAVRTGDKHQLLRTWQIPVPVIRQHTARRQSIVRKILLPATPLLLGCVVLQENGDVFLIATADRTHMPCAAKLRQIGRFLAQPVRPQPCIKLASVR